MSPFPDIKMRGNGQARNDVGVTTSPCRPNLDDFVVHWQYVGKMLATCATKLVEPILKRERPTRACQSEAHLIESQKRWELRSSVSAARLTAEPIKLTTQLTVAIGIRMVSPLDSLELSHPRNISPTRRLGARKGWHIWQPCLRLFRKAKKGHKR